MKHILYLEKFFDGDTFKEIAERGTRITERQFAKMFGKKVDLNAERQADKERFWFERLLTGVLPAGSIQQNGKWLAKTNAFVIDDNVSGTVLGILFGYRGMRFHGMRFHHLNSKNSRWWIIPPLPEARRRWNNLRFHVVWNDKPDWTVDDLTVEAAAS